MEFGMEVLFLMFLVAIVAGFVDAIAGGGGLVALPALLWIGLPPVFALGTNKFQSSFGTFTSSFYFICKGMVSISGIWKSFLCMFFGALLGSWLVSQLESDFLKILIPILQIVIAIYFIFSPNAGKEDSRQKIPLVCFLLVPPILGFYDGFFGPGTGAFVTLSYMFLLGFNLKKATAHAKVLNFGSNLAAVSFFLWDEKVVITIGVVMIFGQIIGTWFGAKLVFLKGSKIIRPFIIVISIAMATKLLFDYWGLL